jgi:hypothetical protein
MVVPLVTLLGLLFLQTPKTYHVNNAVPCADKATGGTEALPFCSLRHASTVARAGDMVLIHAGRYNDGAFTFTRSGTASARITYRAVGDVSFGFDIVDEDFTPAPGLANVYRAPWSNPLPPGQVSQLLYAGILVDDPNQTIFTMVQEDGPMRLSAVTTDSALVANEGTWRLNGGQLYVHAYGHRVPSTADTDFMVGIAGGVAMTVGSSTQWNVFDGLRVLYTFNTGGSNNVYKNLKFQGQSFNLTGSHNTGENISVTHVIVRDQSNWTWHQSASGTAATVTGSASAPHVLRNMHLFHNWNSSIGGSAPGLVIDGLKAHGAPNHCGAAGSGVTLRNSVQYNCQDYFYLMSTNNVVIEHMVNPSGISLEGVRGPVGSVTVRNSIFSGSFGYTSAGSRQNCQWESVSLLENSVVSTSARIERCATGIAYPIAEYISRCASGEFTGCMTIRNNTYVDPATWQTVIAGGMWTGAQGDQWDVTLVAGSPAIDRGIVSGTTTDILGTKRPQGAAPDAGVYEWVNLRPSPPRPIRNSLALRSTRPVIQDLGYDLESTWVAEATKNEGGISSQMSVRVIQPIAQRQALRTAIEIETHAPQLSGRALDDYAAEDVRKLFGTGVKVASTVEDVADHIDHAVKIAGIDHVGIGSDFDGISGPPNGLDDVSKMPALIAVLLERGYKDRDVKKILGENTLRVIREVTGQ